MALRRRIAVVCAGVVAAAAACSSSSSSPGNVTPDGGGTGTAHDPLTFDEIQAALEDGVDDPSPISEDELDQIFPLGELAADDDDPDDRDPTKGDDATFQKAFTDFVPSGDPDAHFTIDEKSADVPDHVVDFVKKGIMFGLANWDAFMPGFSVLEATDGDLLGKPFKVSILTTADETGAFRSGMTNCGAATPQPVGAAAKYQSVLAGTCIPRLVLRVRVAQEASFEARLFIHELSHVAQSYWQMSDAYLAAGGVKQAMAYSDGFAWQHESDAMFNERHAPWGLGYDRLALNRKKEVALCPFEPLRRGAFTWTALSSKGVALDAKLPYQMAAFVDQLTWRRFGKDPAWIYQWYVAKPDRRDTTGATPISAARRLLQMLSKDPAHVDLAGLNRALLETGMDLYGYGRDPWTTRAINAFCIRDVAEIDLPPLSFDAITLDPGDLANVGKLHFELTSSRNPEYVRASVAALDVEDGKILALDCLKAIPDGYLAAAEPRQNCAQYIHPLTALNKKNGWKDDVIVPAGLSKGKHRLAAVVFHFLPTGGLRQPIHVALKAQNIITPPRNTVTKEDCPSITDQYRSHCKTSDCYCVGTAYCESIVEAAPSCEVFERDCNVWCILQKSECDCTSFCDVMKSRLGC